MHSVSHKISTIRTAATVQEEVVTVVIVVVIFYVQTAAVNVWAETLFPVVR